MKNLAFLSFLIVFIMLTSIRGQWEIINEGGSFRTIDFVNDRVGWVAGDGTLLKTEDGGETWYLLTQDENIQIHKIDFINEFVGWAIARLSPWVSFSWRRCCDQTFIILKTEDGGETWIIKKELSEICLEKIYVASNNIVYISGYTGGYQNQLPKILRTVDGGINWTEILIYEISENCEIGGSLWFQDAEKGMFIGNLYSPNPERSFTLKTNNGGKTWDEKSIPGIIILTDLQIINDSTAYFKAGNYEDSFFCVTTDTLNSWHRLTNNDFNIRSFYCLNKDTIFAIMIDDTSNSFIKSTDGGINWSNKEILLGIPLWDTWGLAQIYFVNNNVGFSVVDYSGASFLCRTIDSGENWIVQKIHFPFSDIHFMDKNKGILCGSVCDDPFGHGCVWYPEIFFTKDGGKSWSRSLNTNTYRRLPMLKSCLFLNDLVGFTIGEAIYKTSNSGITWDIVYENNPDSTGFDFWGNDLYFLDENMGWAIGGGSWADDTYGAAILVTTDSGKNWDLVWKYPNNDIYEYSLNSIHFVNTSGWAVGESGLIVKYTEQDQWRAITDVTDLPLHKVFLSDEQRGWIAGGYFDEDNMHLIMLKTKDGGENWQEKELEFQINDMFFEDSLHGWAVGNDTSNSGMILESWDGGDNWNVQIGDLSAPLNALHFKDGFGWAVGDNGLVLRTEDGASWVDYNTGKTFPNKFYLFQNFPNPFNQKTVISYQLPVISDVDLSIYNLLGQKVVTLVNKKQNAGTYQVGWDASGHASGIYYFRIEAGDWQDFRKMILLK